MWRLFVKINSGRMWNLVSDLDQSQRRMGFFSLTQNVVCDPIVKPLPGKMGNLKLTNICAATKYVATKLFGELSETYFLETELFQ